jgi:N-acetylmuramoyl-L-alanine amidase
VYCAVTEACVRSFQQARGIPIDGICDHATWAALVEASWRLGDRLLFLTSPNLRGDDVADLQTRLGRLGFDCGRVDGILGPLTAAAIEEFQGNCGLLADGTCGTDTIQAVKRVSSQTGQGPGIATVRERERLRTSSSSLAGRRVVVGQFGGLSALTRALARDLRRRGTIVVSVDEPDAITQATAANHFTADLYVGFDTLVDGPTRICYYAVPTFESHGGRSLAERIAAGLDTLDTAPHAATGMRLQVLRETRMPAVLVSFSDVRKVTDDAINVAEVVRVAIGQWFQDPL